MKMHRGKALLLLAGLAGSLSATAQKTIVLKQDSDVPQTVVEAEKGYVIVNGDTVVRPGETAYRKIVIDRETDAPEMGTMRGFGGGNTGRANAPKARLGVLTDPQQSQGGAHVREVQPGSPAQAAGLKAGDKITAVDGSTIGSAQELIEVIGAHAPDDTVKIAYERGGKKRTTTAYLEGAPQENAGPSGGGLFGFPGEGIDLSQIFGGGGLFGGGNNAAETPKVGITVEERMDGNGVETLDVTAGSAAEKAGLRKGDVITQLGSTKITSPQGLQSAIRQQQGTEATLRYQRGSKSMTGKILIPKNLKKMEM